jgi:hypothetical protein
MQCILYQIYFWKVFHMYYKLICILYALLCGQNFILVKSGCYILPLDAWPITHRVSLYADDMVLFVAPQHQDLQLACGIMHVFECASGLGCNMAKSQLALIYYSDE